MKNSPLKIDFHVHTCYSYDAVTTPKQLAAAIKARGLDGVAITDHNTIEGYFKFGSVKKEAILILGMEINTLDGHVLALNITEPISAGLSLEETIEKIHEADGIAVASHLSGLKLGKINGSLHGFDAVEIINASAFPLFFSKWRNQKIADAYGLPGTAGSDAHCAFQVGNAYTAVEAEGDAEKIVEAVKKGKTRVFGASFSWKARARCEALMLKKKLG